MLPSIEQLLILQDRDRHLRTLKQELNNVPHEKKAVDDQLAAAASALEKAKGRWRDIELERKRLEIDAESKRDQVGRFKTHQFQTRKNEEFQALTNEIKRFESEISTIEDRELDLMQEYENVKPVIAEADKNFNEQKAILQRRTADLDVKVGAVTNQIESAQQERAGLASQVDEDLLDLFERLFHSKGEAVVSLEHGVCTGCHMKITTQTATRVKNAREITHCEQCGRILYHVE